MSYVDQDRADEKTAKIEGEWMRLSEFFGQERLHSEELFVGDQVHDTAILCYSSGKYHTSMLSCALMHIATGTTGLSKGVEVCGLSLLIHSSSHDTSHLSQTTHNNVVSLLTTFIACYEKADPKTDVGGAVLPFYHIA